jgi:hypothetical protein
MVPIVAPSGANAKAATGLSPTPRTRLDGVATLGGPQIGSQERAMSPRRSRPIHLRLHEDDLEIPIRDLLDPSLAAPGTGPESVVSRRGDDSLRDAWGADGRSIDGSMACAP